MKFLWFAIAASLMLTTASCNSDTKSKKSASIIQGEKLEELSIDTSALPAGAYADTDQRTQDKPPKDIPLPQVNPEWDKKIIKNAVLTIDVEKYEAYNKSIHQMVNLWAGYIAKEEQNDNNYKIENSMTIKVPVERFDEAIGNLSSQKGKVLVKQITSQDVTGEVLDIRSRMEAKKRVRLRYLDMLQKAKNMEEILLVEQEINQMQEQIEAADGRMSYLSHASAYSTIQLTFFQILDPKADDREDPGFGKRLLSSMADGLKWAGELVIILLTLWPVWLVVILSIWLIRKARNTKLAIKNSQ